MNKFLPLAVLAATWSLSLLPCHADPIGPKPGELITVDGFQLSITADSQKFVVNTPITINALLTNVTEQERPIAVGNGADYHIEVRTDNKVMTEKDFNMSPETLELAKAKGWKLKFRGEENIDVPLTRYGQQIERSKGTSFGIGVEVAPGSNDSQKIPLNQLFDMTIPGDYTVKVSHYIRFPNEKGAKEAVSNTLHITVRWPE